MHASIKGSPSAVVVTTNGIISGLGALGQWRPNVRDMKARMSSSYIGFVGYLPQPSPGFGVKMYAVLHRKPAEVCFLATK